MVTNSLNDRKIKAIVKNLENKKLTLTSHLYKRFPEKSIGEAAEVFANKYSNEAREKPALALLAVVLSIHSNYTKIVEPRIDRIRQTEFSTFVDLKEKTKNIDTFTNFCEMSALEKYNIIIGILAAIDKLKERSAEADDFEVLHKWAMKADFRNHEKDIIGSIKGVGLATFQHLRMNFGADTVKPDQRVKEVLKREFGFELSSGIENIVAVEYIAKVMCKSALYIDQVFVNYGSGYYALKENKDKINNDDSRKANGKFVERKEQRQDKLRKVINTKGKHIARNLGFGNGDILFEVFNEYFAEREMNCLIVENQEKRKKNKNAHFYEYRKGGQTDGVLENFIYISPTGNLCLTTKDATKLKLILDYDYTISNYNHSFKAVLINQKYYTNFSKLLDELVALHN
jgi:hypothetical protein